MRKNILIIDDEQNICTSLSYALEDHYKVFSATEAKKGLDILKNEKINLVLLDLKIGKSNGLEILEEIKAADKDVLVIMMTAFGTIETAVEAIKLGAFTYLTKPLDIKKLLITINQGLEYQNLNKRIQYLSNELKDKYSYGGIIGKSPVMEEIYELIDALKDVDTNVLIVGESGTGKELIARAIHYSGIRSSENFVGINCAAIPDGLLESELFGYAKGAFTGANTDKVGKLELADKGTILLDEIGDMSINLQTKVLRVLEEREFTPLGSNKKLKLNSRIIASTNKDLVELIKEDKFREDLYFRLNVIEIKVPPLRERKQDLPLLFVHFIKKHNKKLNKNVTGLSKEAEEVLLNHSYPGNIRELANIIEHGVLLSKSRLIKVEYLPRELKCGDFKSDIGKTDNSLVGMTIKDVEKRIIKETLEYYEGHQKSTAKMLGISERGLRNKIKEYKL